MQTIKWQCFPNATGWPISNIHDLELDNKPLLRFTRDLGKEKVQEENISYEIGKNQREGGLCLQGQEIEMTPQCSSFH